MLVTYNRNSLIRFLNDEDKRIYYLNTDDIAINLTGLELFLTMKTKGYI